ncbi:MAG: S8 family serine peptidase [Steroidobacteraceae bacterium]
MRSRRSFRAALSAAALAAATLWLCAWPVPGRAADSVVFRHRARDPQATDQIIVKWRADGVAALNIPLAADRATQLRAVTGVAVVGERALFGHTDVLQLDRVPTHEEMQRIIARLQADPAVQYAEPNGYRYIADFPQDAAPNDPLFSAGSDSNGSWTGQWYLQPSSAATPAALSVTTAWKNSGLGASSIVVAVIDTGIIEGHPDFTYPAGSGDTPKLDCVTGSGGGSACGYDFVSCDQGNASSSGSNAAQATTADCSASGSAATYYFANDGHGWAADAADPGDWISSTDVGLSVFQNAGCTDTAPSSWHGTKVAGVIGAVTNNGIGIAGIAPMTTILPVRALGVCTGRVADVAAAILWAAGIGVTVDAGTIAASPAANIINLSLAAAAPCSQTEQDAINQAIGAGVLVIAAAGNEGGPLDAPASCAGVLSVAGLRASGTKVPYSNVSSADAAVSIAAPGGNCVNADAGTTHTVGYTVPCVYAIETTTNAGSTSPSGTPGAYTYAEVNQSYQSYVDSGGNTDNIAVVGTSFAAPMAAGVAALMLAAHPGLTPSQVIARLRSSALPFPTSSSTTSTACAVAPTTTDSNGNYTDTSQQVECVCTTATCGAGMLNAAAAVQAASSMYVQIAASSTTGSPGKQIRLDGSGSTAAAGFSIVDWQWTATPANSDELSDANQPVARLVVPALRSIDVTLTITDNAGNTASASTEIQSSLGAGSGVGTFDPLWLGLLGGCAGWQIQRRRRALRGQG